MAEWKTEVRYAKGKGSKGKPEAAKAPYKYLDVNGLADYLAWAKANTQDGLVAFVETNFPTSLKLMCNKMSVESVKGKALKAKLATIDKAEALKMLQGGASVADVLAKYNIL